MPPVNHLLIQNLFMDKFSYAIGLGIGQNLLSMGARSIDVNDFAQAIKDVLEGNQTAISHNEAREIVNKYFTELEEKMNAENIEKGKAFLEENKKNPNIVTCQLQVNERFVEPHTEEASNIFSKHPTGLQFPDDPQHCLVDRFLGAVIIMQNLLRFSIQRRPVPCVYISDKLPVIIVFNG